LAGVQNVPSVQCVLTRGCPVVAFLQGPTKACRLLLVDSLERLTRACQDGQNVRRSTGSSPAFLASAGGMLPLILT
jgi:hypothetical protein